MKLVFIVNESWDNYHIYSRRYWGRALSIEDADLVQLTGGVDINPALYGQKKHPRTQSFNVRRDEQEIEAYNLAVKLGKPIAGVCRGAQLINVLNGGSMWQDVNNHQGAHNITDAFTGEIKRVNSVHHQMMIPSDDAVIVATASGQSSRRERMDDGIAESVHGVSDDPEIVFYPKTKSLCFQAHPEFDDMTAKVYFHYLNKYLNL